MTQKKHYTVVLTKTAEKEYKSIKDLKLLKRVNAIIEDLETNPLTGKPLYGEYEGCRVVKTFSFRLIYLISKSDVIITVVKIQHRKDSYR